MPTRSPARLGATLGALVITALGSLIWWTLHPAPPASTFAPHGENAQFPPRPALVPRAPDVSVSAAPASPPPATAPAPVREDLARIFPASELPQVATERGAAASLGYLAENGADLSKPMPSKHRVVAANPEVAAQLIAWAGSHDFAVRGPHVVREHIGTPRLSLELVRTEVPSPARIEQQGRLVLDAVRAIPGTYYVTWSGEIVR